MRKNYDNELQELGNLLTEMAFAAEDAIDTVTSSLENLNSDAVAETQTITKTLDQMERDIENRCLKLLLRQQPVARDLRQISAALKMITDLERIGDQAEEIADIIGFIDGHNPEDYITLTEMAKAAIHMVTESIDAYVKHDTILAEKVVDEDDIVDEYFLQVKSKLIAKIAKDPDDGEYALDLLMIAKYFERIGDHAVNIAEWVIFSVTGVHRGE